MIRLALLLFSFIGLLFFQTGCGRREADEEHAKPEVAPASAWGLLLTEESEKKISLQLETAQLSSVGQWVSFPGTLDVDRNKPLLVIKVVQPGIIAQLALGPGDPVHRGQTLVLIDRAPIECPVLGTVAEVFVRDGDSVSVDQALFTLLDLSHLVAYLDVYEDQLPKARVGRSLSLTVPAFPRRTFLGEIKAVSPQLDPQTRSGVIRVVLKNADELLKPGMAVSGTMTLPGPEKGLMVPESAVVFDSEGGAWIYVQTKPHSYLRRPVQIAFLGQGQLLVKQGLGAGERFVAVGAQDLFSQEFSGQISIAD